MKNYITPLGSLCSIFFQKMLILAFWGTNSALSRQITLFPSFSSLCSALYKNSSSRYFYFSTICTISYSIFESCIFVCIVKSASSLRPETLLCMSQREVKEFLKNSHFLRLEFSILSIKIVFWTKCDQSTTHM